MIAPVDVVNLTALMKRHRGRPTLRVGLIDGPVACHHPDLAREGIHQLPGGSGGCCHHAAGAACRHGTFVAGILKANRGSGAPGICTDCTLLLRPIFAESGLAPDQLPGATAENLASAIVECIAAGATILNISAALLQCSPRAERLLQEALSYSIRQGVAIVAAAGNQGIPGSSFLTRHPWVIPVAACNLQGRPLSFSNFGSLVGRQGLSAPGDTITSLGSEGNTVTAGGTSAAAPFVTGTIALLWSAFPAATAVQIKLALTHGRTPRWPSVIPPLLDAEAAYQFLAAASQRKQF